MQHLARIWLHERLAIGSRESVSFNMIWRTYGWLQAIPFGVLERSASQPNLDGKKLVIASQPAFRAIEYTIPAPMTRTLGAVFSPSAFLIAAALGFFQQTVR